MKFQDPAAKKNLPICPSCAQKFHHEAHSCPHCGFSFEISQNKFGHYTLESLRVNDRSGCLRNVERKELKKYLAKLEKKCPPLILSVHIPSQLEPLQLRSYAAWFINSVRLQPEDFERTDLDPSWLLTLIIDISNKGLVFSYGYKLDPYFNETNLYTALHAGNELLSDEDYLEAIKLIMKKAVALLEKNVKNFHPNRYTDYQFSSLPSSAEITHSGDSSTHHSTPNEQH